MKNLRRHSLPKADNIGLKPCIKQQRSSLDLTGERINAVFVRTGSVKISAIDAQRYDYFWPILLNALVDTLAQHQYEMVLDKTRSFSVSLSLANSMT